jgi:hypothetical protein
MRKILKRDYLALSAPALLLVLVAILRGLEQALGLAIIVVPFVLWLWVRQIRKYPEDTWRLRI